jgi:hypothetical protein
MELTFIFVCVAVLFVRKMHLASEKEKKSFYYFSFMGGRAESSGWPFTPLPID